MKLTPFAFQTLLLSITVRNYFTGDAAKIDAIVFAGGVVWDRETINGRFEIANDFEWRMVA